MFDFGNANDGQRQAISTTEGPVLITAGPGTGKTYTLVQRAIYLIEERYFYCYVYGKSSEGVNHTYHKRIGEQKYYSECQRNVRGNISFAMSSHY